MKPTFSIDGTVLKQLSAEWTSEDIRLAESVFGTAEADAIVAMTAAWCKRETGEVLARILTFETSVGAGIGVAFASGRTAFLKVWPAIAGSEALAAQAHVQGALHEQGFPAPQVLSRVGPLGPGHALLMSLETGGQATDARRPGVRNGMARCLARLVEEARPFVDLPGLPGSILPADPALPWGIPHNVLFDFAATAKGAAWIDALAASALAVLRKARGRVVVGHMDWSAKNMRVSSAGDVAIVYDWDSLRVERETIVAGVAAATFPVTWDLPVPKVPTRADSAAFIRAYEDASGRPFAAEEQAEIAAAMTYVRAYTARCEHALDPHGASWQASFREALFRDGA